jgi:hypothetical protein
LTSGKRLLVREGDIVLSGAIVGTSPVTRCVPRTPLNGGGNVVFLRSADRELIEQWLETGAISLMRSDPPHGLARVRGEAASHVLEVTSGVEQKKKALRFNAHHPDRENTQYQADFKREEFQSDWTVILHPAWFSHLRQVWADRWFASLGRYNQIIRPHNARLVLRVSAEQLEIIFNRQEGGHQSPSEAFPFPDPIKPPPKLVQETTYFSKDIGPVLFNIADAEIEGAVTMAGNKHALVLRYQTPSGDFEIAVPTLNDDETGRDEALFYRWRGTKI